VTASSARAPAQNPLKTSATRAATARQRILMSSWDGPGNVNHAAAE
jgi:hypothetical protein